MSHQTPKGSRRVPNRASKRFSSRKHSLIRPRRDAEIRRAILAAILLVLSFNIGARHAAAQEEVRAENDEDQRKPSSNVSNIVVGTPEDLGAALEEAGRERLGFDQREGISRTARSPQGRRRADRTGETLGRRIGRGARRSPRGTGETDDRTGATLNEDGPIWVSARLDGSTVTRVLEGNREWPVRHAEDGAWQVELRGKGKALEIELIAPVVPGTEGHRLELAIPEAALTRLAIDVGPKVLDAVVGAKGSVAIEPIDNGKRTRLSAHVSPRSRLELAWRLESDPGRKLPPLLIAQGEIALDIDRGFGDATANWVIRSDRGIVRELKFRLDPAEELLELKLDDQPLSVDGKRERGSAIVVVPLAEPLRAGSSRKLAFKMRRVLVAGETPRWDFRGFAIENAAEQRGVLAINQGDDLWIEGEPGRDLRRIDPRADLADHARTPATVLAYQFLDQPFELHLRVDPSPPRVRVASRTSVTIEGGRVRVDAWFDYQLASGWTFEARIETPSGLEIESVGPEDEVESSRALKRGRAGQGRVENDGNRPARLGGAFEEKDARRRDVSLAFDRPRAA